MTPSPQKIESPDTPGGFKQRAPRGVDVKDLRPLRGRPFGPIPDPDASLGAAQQQAKRTFRKIDQQEPGVDRPHPFRDDLQIHCGTWLLTDPQAYAGPEHFVDLRGIAGIQLSSCARAVCRGQKLGQRKPPIMLRS